jgi:hypothetical protein
MLGGLSPGRSWEFFSSPSRPDQIWGPPSLLCTSCPFPAGKAAGGANLTTHFHLVPRLRMRRAMPLLPNTPVWHGHQLGKAQGQLYLYFDRCSMVRFRAGAGNFSLHRVQNGTGAHLASYPMGTRGSFPGSKAAGA